MIKSNLKITWRNLLKNKTYFSINVLGLSIALTVSFLMLLWANDEWNMDKFHEQDAQLYLAKRTIPLEGNVLDVYNNVSYPFLEAAKAEIPEIENYLILGPAFEDNLTHDNVNFRARGSYTKANFFKDFSFPVLLGDIDQLDAKVEALAISESLAHRIWGDEWRTRALGSTIHIHDNGDFSVEAVYADFPEQSSIRNEFYYSFDNFLNRNEWVMQWGSNGMRGVFVLDPKADPALVSTKTHELFQANLSGEFKEGIIFQKFSDNYLYGNFDEQARVSGGRIEYVRIFTIAAIFLLIISCINFINLATAYATKRAAEIGVRKSIGARKGILISQFLTETALITSIAFLIAYFLTLLLLPATNDFTAKNLALNPANWTMWLVIIGVYLVTTLLSGLYPAAVISSFKPVDALKGKSLEKKNTISLRKGLVVLQFTLTTLLIVAAMVVRLQVDYINQKDLGIAKDHIISIHQDQKLTEKYDVLREELVKSPAVRDVTLVGPSPLHNNASTGGVVWPGKREDQSNIEFNLQWTSHNFPEVFDIPLADGNYYREGLIDTLQIVVNERAVEIMGLEDPIGKTIELWRTPRQIIGVLKDYHNRSLYEPIQPGVYLLDALDAGNMFVKLKAGSTEEGLTAVQQAFAAVLPDVPLHYDFLDEQHAANYRSEIVTGGLTFYFALVSILISCLGLFGLATFVVKQRTKEIGIRKVLGASVSNITSLISKDFLKLVTAAILIATPVAWFFMSKWLEGFAYKIEMSWWVFAITGLFTVLIAFLTIGFHTLRSAQSDPVESLRTE
ncbi:FtsX-like permease family protein [Poritiphilus flavus]|uniref:FtsX-like permease family protein n=1 Tax=Poritiphilus flavus TaxID=2697053 RepID=A0A6L9EAN1_9FLAO|nr:FtsX-like permease family protein [Poritiphilus flavus]NAS11618.1 FtsX-like permease family protein [Poritiphilus flavus]